MRFDIVNYDILIRRVWTAHDHLYVFTPESVQVYNKYIEIYFFGDVLAYGAGCKLSI